MMSEENTNVEEQQEQAPQENMFSEDQVRGMIAEAIQNEVAGLKNKNQELLGKLKAKDNEIKEEALKKEGTFDEMKSHWEGKYNELKEEYENKYADLKNAAKERDKSDIIAKLAGEFVDSEAGSFMLRNMVDVEDGNQVYRDFSGNVVADNLGDFKKWMATNPHMSHLVRGTKATGGGANGGASKASGGELTREQWDGLSTEKKIEMCKNPRFVPPQA